MISTQMEHKLHVEKHCYRTQQICCRWKVPAFGKSQF